MTHAQVHDVSAALTKRVLKDVLSNISNVYNESFRGVTKFSHYGVIQVKQVI
jgi:hypothetical protein